MELLRHKLAGRELCELSDRELNALSLDGELTFNEQSLARTTLDRRNAERGNVAPQRVTVVDVQMSFGAMVRTMVLLGLASIPALLILALIGVLASGFFTGLLMSVARH
jgi:hypothetical protein